MLVFEVVGEEATERKGAGGQVGGETEVRIMRSTTSITLSCSLLDCSNVGLIASRFDTRG